MQDIAQDVAQLGLRRKHVDLNHCHHPMQVWTLPELEKASKYVSKYEVASEPKCEWKDLVCHLGDDPRTEKGWVTWSARSSAVPTLRKSGGLIAAPAAQRHLTLKELYLGMGYPTFDFAANVAQVKIYDAWRGLTYHEARKALGNSMHAAQVGVFVACLLACTGAAQKQ